MSRLFFAPNKEKAKEYARKVIGTNVEPKRAKRQIKHISNWTTYSIRRK